VEGKAQQAEAQVRHIVEYLKDKAKDIIINLTT
jgi:uncharacterized protein YjbJ (UPF0337 family)